MDLRSIDVWRAHAPRLHIEDLDFFRALAPLAAAPQQTQAVAAALKTEGYFQGGVGNWGVDLNAMANTVRRLSELNLSPAFAFVYDEFWAPYFKLHHLFEGLLGGKYFFLPDFWVWNVDPRRGEAGWVPHRDRGYKSLFGDGTPKSITAWIPLSAATPLNGCMYVVPAHLDPNYGTERDSDYRFELPSIRALPGNPGDLFIWNQAILHWGGRSSPRAVSSRVSMSIELQRADVPPFNQPLLEPLRVLPFDQRLKLIAKQVLQYKHMYKLEPEMEHAVVALMQSS